MEMSKSVVVHTSDGETENFEAAREQYLTVLNGTNHIEIWDCLATGYKTSCRAEFNNRFWTWVDYRE